MCDYGQCLVVLAGRRPGSQTIYITSISSHGAKASGIAVDDEIVAVDDVDASDRSIKWVTDTMSGRSDIHPHCSPLRQSSSSTALLILCISIYLYVCVFVCMHLRFVRMHAYWRTRF